MKILSINDTIKKLVSRYKALFKDNFQLQTI
jgi:hypothetical protein